MSGHYSASLHFGPVQYRAVAILAIAVFLAGAVLGFLTLIIIGIHRGDRARHFADAPHTHVEEVTRRVLGAGTRNNPDGNTSEED